MLFILSGSLIHTQSNYQSIFRCKINHFSIKTSFLLLVTILMLSLAKEGIIHCLHFCISSYVIFSLSLLSSVFTTIYSIKILVYCFNYVLFVYSGYLSIIVPVLTLSSLLIDESLDLVKYTIDCNFSIIVWILVAAFNFILEEWLAMLV